MHRLPPHPATDKQPPPSIVNLPSEMLMAVVDLGGSVPNFLAMQATCAAWRTALLELSEEEVNFLWRSFALARFPCAAMLRKHLRSPISWKQLYRSQLQATKAKVVLCAPPPPCKTNLSDYLFTLEVTFFTINGVGGHDQEGSGSWSGFLQAAGWDVGGRLCELWPVEEQPAWLPAWLQAFDQDRGYEFAEAKLRVHVTKLATLDCIVLCDDIELTRGDYPWVKLPAASRMRLNDQWRVTDIIQFNPVWSEGTDREDDPPLLRNDGVGRVVQLDFDFGEIPSHAEGENDDTGTIPESHVDFVGYLGPVEMLRYLEHYAPWHVNDSDS
jgi:hypothetical protein